MVKMAEIGQKSGERTKQLGTKMVGAAEVILGDRSAEDGRGTPLRDGREGESWVNLMESSCLTALGEGNLEERER